MQYRQTDVMPRTARERTAFGLRLYEARKAAGLSQKQVFAQAGIPQSTLSELETVAASSGYTAQLAALYKVDAHVLATGEPAMATPSTAQEPAKQYAAFSEQERQFIADLRELLEEDRARIVNEIAIRADQMRRHLQRVVAPAAAEDYRHLRRDPPETHFLVGGNQATEPAKKAGT